MKKITKIVYIQSHNLIDAQTQINKAIEDNTRLTNNICLKELYIIER